MPTPVLVVAAFTLAPLALCATVAYLVRFSLTSRRTPRTALRAVRHSA